MTRQPATAAGRALADWGWDGLSIDERVDRILAIEAETAAPDFDALRVSREWPTPISMRHAADALDMLVIPRYGDVLRWFADLCDADPIEAEAAAPAPGLRAALELIASADTREGERAHDATLVARAALAASGFTLVSEESLARALNTLYERRWGHSPRFKGRTTLNLEDAAAICAALREEGA